MQTFINKIKSHYAVTAALKEYTLPGSNLFFYGFDMDTNGNTIAKLGFPNQPKFSIQTNQNMPKSHAMRSSKEFKDTELKTIAKEAIDYIQQHGSSKQQASLKIY